MPSKNPSPTPTAAASTRKRKQNRISQQCLREKKSALGVGGGGGTNNNNNNNPAAALGFDRLAADVAALREGCEARGQVEAAAVLRVNERLVGENRALREALLRMRKKMLSLSGAADSAAGESVRLGKDVKAGCGGGEGGSRGLIDCEWVR